LEDGPDGVPIGRALAVSPGIANDDFRIAIAAIDRVHGDGSLPTIPIRLAALPRSASDDRVCRGQFVTDLDGRPITILIEVAESHRTFAAVHEIGHFIDFAGIGQHGRFASSAAPVLNEWRRVVARSRAIQDLVGLTTSLSRGVHVEHVEDLLDPVEIWARSYSQYIALRSRSLELLASLDAFRTRAPVVMYYPQQWEDDDFEPIDEAIEWLFRRLGWRRQPPS